ncbi:conjugal transfer protein TraF, partial [Escherichia coli]
MNKALLPLLLCCFIFPASGKDAGWQWYNEKINPKEKENKPVSAAPRQEPDIMQKLAEHYGIMFFYRGQDPIDGQLAQVINGFRDTYGLSVIPVSVDGVINPLLPDSRTDQGQAQRLG